jgi:hypothetical protein
MEMQKMNFNGLKDLTFNERPRLKTFWIARGANLGLQEEDKDTHSSGMTRKWIAGTHKEKD